jgi:hypothetical protein
LSLAPSASRAADVRQSAGIILPYIFQFAQAAQADEVGWLDQLLLHQIDQTGAASSWLGVAAVLRKRIQRFLGIRRLDIDERVHPAYLPLAAT